MKPMLLCRNNPDPKYFSYPIYVAPKLDGIRCLIVDGKAVTRTLKRIPNKHINEVLSYTPTGLDGELIVGPPTSSTVYRDTNSAVMSKEGEPDFTYWVFDVWDDPYVFSHRQHALHSWYNTFKPQYPHIKLVEHKIAETIEDFFQMENDYLEEGYEGVIIRDPRGMYKFGRTTMRESNAYKYKRFKDSEAYILDILPEMHNTNEEKRDATGKMQRSVSKKGLVAKQSMGALSVYDKENKWTFEIGSGFTKEDRDWFWKNKDELLSERTFVKYKYFPIGIKDKPRFPIYLGLRSKEDM